MSGAAEGRVNDPPRRRDHMYLHLRRLIADALNVSAEKFADSNWLMRRLDVPSLMAAAIAIEREYRVRLTAPQIVELTCVADLMDVAVATASCSAGTLATLSRSHDAVDPAAFDW